MKKLSNYFVSAICIIAIAFSAGAFIKVNANTNNVNSMPGQPVDLTYAAEKALPAVVHIRYLQNSKIQTVEMQSDPFGDFFDPFGFFGNPGGTTKRKVQTPKREGAGSGVIISADGYIVTNNHVVEGADELTVTLNDNREFSARIVGTDKTTDLALIKVDAKDLPTLPIGDSNKLKVGEWVLAVGNPFNLNSTVTAGIVSAKARTIGANGVESFIQTDAAINAGNSGGALVNTQGELVGINAMLVSPTQSYTGYGFAIPTTIMNKVVADLKQYGTVQRAMIGIQGINANDYYDKMKEEGKEVDLGTMEGIYIDNVEDGSAGAEAGLQKGDVITAVDGKKLKKMAELQEYLANKRPGDKITITYLRNKKSKTATLTLKNQQGNTDVVKHADLDVLGGNFREINDSEKRQLNINNGLVVMRINNGALKDAGINKGFIIQKVNDIPMTTISDLQKAVREASTSKEPVLYIQGIYPTGKKAYFAVPLQND
ncbi:Do family serine endopeptidase [Marseilla massiliensis]|uniref:Do family serine endopeptidase n=1 Tax=Marseilla massiliensis TaxID=1841864 RepID=A0A938WRH0_9BACT|nr:Do family serine endopeptidase [Marseilla massiliensis]MBM6673336.1 Do family serine endopeptidase [Marseilla massiliensis]CCY64336.1 serine protease HtrA [Prevotella sp. CAG:1124]